MANRNVKLKNRNGDYLYPYTENIPIASILTAGKVQLDSSPTLGSNNAITSGAVFTALNSAISDSAMAHKAGNETFTGIKTLQVADDDAWLIKKVNGDYTEASPAVQVTGAYRVVDKNGKIIGDVRFIRKTSGLQKSSLVARNAVTGSEVNCVISCNVDKNGNVYTSAPTPETSDNSTKIATTEFVKAQGYIGNTNLAVCHVVLEKYVNGTSWYRVWSDGWIEQGGRVSISQDTQTTVTLLKTFSNTNYTVLISACRSGTQTGGDGNFTVEYVSASQFKWSNGDDFGGTGIWYACGY